MDFLSHSFPSPCSALGDTEHDAALRTDLMSRTRPSPCFCFPRLWIFSKHLLFPEFTFPREEQLQEIVSVKSPGKKTVMWYRSNPEKRWERLLLQRALPKGNQPTVNNVSGKRRQTFNHSLASTACSVKLQLSFEARQNYPLCFLVLFSGSGLPRDPAVLLISLSETGIKVGLARQMNEWCSRPSTSGVCACLIFPALPGHPREGKRVNTERVILSFPRVYTKSCYWYIPQSTFTHITEVVLALCPQIQQN